jgi:RNA polymerase sigma factor (TIGR02999 family)
MHPEAVMTVPATHEVTRLLQAWSAGDEAALERLTPLVHNHLRQVARRYMAGERTGHILQTSALVNEAYLRLFDCRQLDWRDRAHFFAVCAQLMRRILIDIARSARYQKRGGGAPHVSLDEALAVGQGVDVEIESLDHALDALAAVDLRKSRVVECRFFGGLSVDETAEVLKVSKETVARDWRLAKAWLLRELSKRRENAV